MVLLIRRREHWSVVFSVPFQRSDCLLTYIYYFTLRGQNRKLTSTAAAAASPTHILRGSHVKATVFAADIFHWLPVKKTQRCYLPTDIVSWYRGGRDWVIDVRATSICCGQWPCRGITIWTNTFCWQLNMCSGIYTGISDIGLSHQHVNASLKDYCKPYRIYCN